MIKQLYISMIRQYFTVMSFFFPVAAGKKAFMLFQKARKLPFKEVEKKFYKTARKFEVVHPRENVQAYELGSPLGKLVILVHGWESNAGSMGAIAQQLGTEGKRVIALDLPAHGNSLLTHTNLRDCREALRALIYQLRPTEPFSIVSHSFGSAVASFALAGTRYEIDNFIMLTSPNRLIDFFYEFKTQIRLGENAYNEMLLHAQAILNESVCDANVELKGLQINYQKLTLIHDINDKVLPYSNSARLNKVLPNADLIALKNAGHYRMLWSESVVRKVVSKLREEQPVENYLDQFVSELISA